MRIRHITTPEELDAFARDLDWPTPTHFSRAAAAAWTAGLHGAVDPAALCARCESSEALRRLRVDAQASGTGVYSGDEARRRDVSVKLASLLSLVAAGGAPDHWLAAAAGARLYLAQAPLFVDGADGVDAAPLAGLVVADGSRAGDALPPFVPRRAGAACHLWLAPGAVASAPHCDEDHNVLTVLRGRKTVALAPPRSGGVLCAAAPPWAAAPNHGARHLGDAPRIALGAGEALLLPAGWYHAVESEPGTVAVNAWWRPRKDARAGSRVDAAARALRKAGREDPRRDFFDRRALVGLCAARRRRDLGAPASRGDRARARFSRFARCVDGALRAAFGLGAGPPLAGLAALPDGALAAALATAGPRAAAALAALWDRDADACDALLGRLGAEARERAKARLRRGRDAFARASGRRLLRRLAARARRRAARRA